MLDADYDRYPKHYSVSGAIGCWHAVGSGEDNATEAALPTPLPIFPAPKSRPRARAILGAPLRRSRRR